MPETTTISRNAKILIAVAALGYFVDVYDLILFGVVRNPSLASLGLDKAHQLSEGLYLFNIQMAGMLIGGILWGIWGDKKGRKSVLFGSILLYSSANAINGLIHDNSFMDALTQYGILRFIAGIGLAGELGAGITLVNETLPKRQTRHWSISHCGNGGFGCGNGGGSGQCKSRPRMVAYLLFHWRRYGFVSADSPLRYI